MMKLMEQQILNKEKLENEPKANEEKLPKEKNEAILNLTKQKKALEMQINSLQSQLDGCYCNGEKTESQTPFTPYTIQISPDADVMDDHETLSGFASSDNCDESNDGTEMTYINYDPNCKESEKIQKIDVRVDAKYSHAAHQSLQELHTKRVVSSKSYSPFKFGNESEKSESTNPKKKPKRKNTLEKIKKYEALPNQILIDFVFYGQRRRIIL
eukprot:UN03400